MGTEIVQTTLNTLSMFLVSDFLLSDRSYQFEAKDLNVLQIDIHIRCSAAIKLCFIDRSADAGSLLGSVATVK